MEQSIDRTSKKRQTTDFTSILKIRHARLEDMKAIQEIYAYARMVMRTSGNPNQWGDSYPEEEIIIEDINKKQCYVQTCGKEIQAVFMFMIGRDPTYDTIFDGAWPDQETYGVIHRIAAGSKARGVFRQCFEFCRKQIKTLRIDTHEENKRMQHLLEKYGFQRCGIIYVHDQTPRIAYQYSEKSV